MRRQFQNPITYMAASPKNVDDAIAAARKETRDAIIALREQLRAEEAALGRQEHDTRKRD